MEILEYHDSELTREQFHAIVTLTYGVWPSETKTIEQRTGELLNNAGSAPESTRRLVVWKEKAAVAHAHTFVRQIETGMGPLHVLALAGVCTHSSIRGQGMGAKIVTQAFSVLSDSGTAVALFQTGVPEFYEKLGSRLVDNRFVNSMNLATPEANPWWDTHVMIHPAEFSWPAGPIDLLGPGY